MLCGIFGNVERRQVRELITDHVPSMVAAGGHVIWTRGTHGGEDDDPRQEVRRCFAEAGMPEVSFDGPSDGYGVGVNRVLRPDPTPLGDARLFEFLW